MMTSPTGWMYHAPQSDSPLLDLLDAQFAARGRCPPLRSRWVNYRAPALCCDTWQVSRGMLQILLKFGIAGGVVADQPDIVGDIDALEEGYYECWLGWSAEDCL